MHSWCLKPPLLTALVLVPALSPLALALPVLQRLPFHDRLQKSGLYADTTLGNDTYVESGDEEEVDGPSVENGLPYHGTWLHPSCCLIQMVRPSSVSDFSYILTSQPLLFSAGYCHPQPKHTTTIDGSFWLFGVAQDLGNPLQAL